MKITVYVCLSYLSLVLAVFRRGALQLLSSTTKSIFGCVIPILSDVYLFFSPSSTNCLAAVETHHSSFHFLLHYPYISLHKPYKARLQLSRSWDENVAWANPWTTSTLFVTYKYSAPSSRNHRANLLIPKCQHLNLRGPNKTWAATKRQRIVWHSRAKTVYLPKEPSSSALKGTS